MMNSKGYIFTPTVVILVIIIISLAIFHTQISESKMDDTLNKIKTDELHYFVESVKKDYQRAVSISAQRATAYLIEDILRTGDAFEFYAMTNCTEFNYSGVGSQAAISELMLCGTLYGSATGVSAYMENHTLLNWSDRIVQRGDSMNFVVNVTPKKIEIMPYDGWNYFIVGYLDLSVHDRLNQSFFGGYDIPVTSIISTAIMLDPSYYRFAGELMLVRYFTPCNETATVNGTTIDDWINTECYHLSNISNPPSFFDRLDRGTNGSAKYVNQSILLSSELELPIRNIGVEGFMDLDKAAAYGVSVNKTLSWVDYLYWQNTPAYCGVSGMVDHPEFRIDEEHAIEYRPKGLYCVIEVSNKTGVGVFTPQYITTPTGTQIRWTNVDTETSHTVRIDSLGWENSLAPGEQATLFFNNIGLYEFTCTIHGASGNITVV